MYQVMAENLNNGDKGLTCRMQLGAAKMADTQRDATTASSVYSNQTRTGLVGSHEEDERAKGPAHLGDGPA